MHPTLNPNKARTQVHTEPPWMALSMQYTLQELQI